MAAHTADGMLSMLMTLDAAVLLLVLAAVCIKVASWNREINGNCNYKVRLHEPSSESHCLCIHGLHDY